MSPLLRRSAGSPPRRPHAGLLRREQRALERARGDALRELGGLLVEMYRRGALREDLLYERCATIIGIDSRLAQIADLLHPQRNAPRCVCGARILRGAHFCPNCGRSLEPTEVGSSETVVETVRSEDRQG